MAKYSPEPTFQLEILGIILYTQPSHKLINTIPHLKILNTSQQNKIKPKINLVYLLIFASPITISLMQFFFFRGEKIEIFSCKHIVCVYIYIYIYIYVWKRERDTHTHTIQNSVYLSQWIKESRNIYSDCQEPWKDCLKHSIS